MTDCIQDILCEFQYLIWLLSDKRYYSLSSEAKVKKSIVQIQPQWNSFWL